MVNRLMGDQVIGLFVPRFAGKDHAKVAIHAAQELLKVTGHEDPKGSWIPVGAGVHTGTCSDPKKLGRKVALCIKLLPLGFELSWGQIFQGECTRLRM